MKQLEIFYWNLLELFALDARTSPQLMSRLDRRVIRADLALTRLGLTAMQRLHGHVGVTAGL